MCAASNLNKEGGRSWCSSVVRMFPLSLSVLLGWTEVVKTLSRRQSVLVCSLLVVSLLLTAAVGEECAHGFVPSDTINIYGPYSSGTGLLSTSRNRLYVFPSMNFSCNGTITDIRMRMDFVEGRQPGQVQEVVVYFLLFHDGLNSPNRSVTHILLNSANTRHYRDVATLTITEIFHAHSLSLPVTEGTFIGLAIPANDSRIFSRNINLSPLSAETTEAHIYQLAAPFSEFEGRVLEAARTADSSQFTTQMIALPLIDVSVGPGSLTLPPSPTPLSSSTPFSSTTPSTSTLPSPSSEATPDTGLSQLVTIVIVVVVTTVLLMVVVSVLVAAMVTVVHRRRSKQHVYEGADANRGVRYQETNTLKSTTYYEPMSLDVDHTHFHRQPHPLHTPHANTTSDNGDHISMQDCPAYQSIEDTPTSGTGDYTYI